MEQTAIPHSFPGRNKVQQESRPYVVRVFQRAFRYCHTVAQLTKVFSTFEYRLTPKEIEYLFEWHQTGELLPAKTAIKFQQATTGWLNEIKKLMQHSGKSKPEPFSSHKLAPHITLFSGIGSAEDKTLIICFPPNGTRHLTIPNTVLMQHTDATRFDLLMVSDYFIDNPHLLDYQLGSLPFGQHLTKVIEQLSKVELVNQYSRIRTMGFSAGAHPAIVAGYLLNAEMAHSISGRFHRKKRILKVLDKVITT